ncbi:tRNA (adenosine(37)-N6)-dimethylallyltransferase MiaA [Aureibacter tunicatorum]|uniref:tRNA dimethylallyltransferase n=1 Tax=Aureibacter tunicatorum TaxID=866807 RepID=A0AAE4BSR4_9BACT|nr:tRNA (adenosine(37)-N6)-dimethylallyltransferase MiaA [Aureibacter tunicatorum]MDR6239140.1 tRNA dimethylallyltransferase [Aureibacter tunicatorum]BDD04934.1 tRNA dimethylallyltransferase 2 [Aureibacter tunicatorum]
MNYNLIVILGPTASGKTNLAVNLALAFGGEIISADSRQVYRKMDIGTGKDLSEYVVDGKQVPYHLIDVLEPGEKYNVFEFQRDFIKAYKDIRGRDKLPILCGGTGLYIEAILENYQDTTVPVNPALRGEVEQLTQEELKSRLMNVNPNTRFDEFHHRKRLIRALEIEVYKSEMRDHQVLDAVSLKPLIIGMDIDREERRKKISARLDSRLDEGMVEEVQGLLQYCKAEDLIYYGLEYKWLTEYLLGKVDFDVMKSRLEVGIHQYAKRQMTWFRKMERSGYCIHWLKHNDPMVDKLSQIKELMDL